MGIKGLSLSTALKNAFFKPTHGEDGAIVRSLIEEFDYPSRGPGMMWEKMAHLVQEMGGEVQLSVEVERIRWSGHQVEHVEIANGTRRESVRGTHYISTIPIRELLERIEPAVPAGVLAAAKKLNYRDFISVILIVNQAEVFPDNWIYIHDPEVKLGRVQNFKNWSPEMVPDLNKTCLGLEYFCFEGDGLWTATDAELIELGKSEMERLGLIKASDVEDGVVVRVPKAYPVYDASYKEALLVVRQFLSTLNNLQLVGRNGMHKYNNQDHSMLTAMLAVENVLGASHDIWEVNVDQEYLEEVDKSENERHRDLMQLTSTQPNVPERLTTLPNAAEWSSEISD